MGFIHNMKVKVESAFKSVEQMKDNQEGTIGALFIAGIIAIVALVVIAILGSALLPSSIGTIVNTSTTGWATGTSSMWTAVPTFLVLGFLLIVLGIALYVLKALDM